MAQTQKATALGFAEICKLVQAVTTAMAAGASGMKSIVGLTGACTAAEASTFANPGGATKLAANGFTLVDADTVVQSTTTETNDTCELDHVFTATGTQSVSGFAVENDDDDVVLAECCFNAAASMENNDTLTCELKMQFKQGA
ncbi:hypothetical protein LCGC14_0567240 [marine sediment metagenome]|uniref:Uncharacterized protein n=1 Tax=marine sediment metagenome TaxID=412755 RepID=A0A0F9S3V8_9ZZZZ